MDRNSYEKAMEILSAMERCVAKAIAELEAIEAEEWRAQEFKKAA